MEVLATALFPQLLLKSSQSHSSACVSSDCVLLSLLIHESCISNSPYPEGSAMAKASGVLQFGPPKTSTPFYVHSLTLILPVPSCLCFLIPKAFLQGIWVYSPVRNLLAQHAIKTKQDNL